MKKNIKNIIFFLALVFILPTHGVIGQLATVHEPNVDRTIFLVNDFLGCDFSVINLSSNPLSEQLNAPGPFSDNSFPLPDLMPFSISILWTEGSYPGAYVGFISQIKNIGSAAVTQTFYIGIYLDGKLLDEEPWSQGVGRGNVLTFYGVFRWPNDESSHVVTVKADSRNQIDESNENNNEKSTTTSAGDPPTTPQKPSGPTQGKPGFSYSYTSRTTNPNRLEVRYYFDWGDGTGGWTTLMHSGETVSRSHSWQNDGTYYVRVKTEDGYGMESKWSSSLRVTVASNFAPEKPAKPIGQESGQIRRQYTFSTSTTDYDKDMVYFLWDWGDGSTSEWIGPYNSGDTCETPHKWKKQGEYNVKVKAKDEHGAESDWSPPLSVAMPKNKPVIMNPLFQYLLEFLQDRFPRLIFS